MHWCYVRQPTDVYAVPLSKRQAVHHLAVPALDRRREGQHDVSGRHAKEGGRGGITAQNLVRERLEVGERVDRVPVPSSVGRPVRMRGGRADQSASSSTSSISALSRVCMAG